jgi:cyclase
MLRPRIIPCLLVHEGGLVKTTKFKNPKYVGDPINAVKIFNEKEADELIILDIDATVKGLEPNYKFIADIAAECRMPLCYGGGVRSPDQAKRIIGLGVEKVAISAAAISDPSLVLRVAETVGRQSVVIVLDVFKKSSLLSKGYNLHSHNAQIMHKINLVDFAIQMQDLGAGEIVINLINRDGEMTGYDLDLAAEFRAKLDVPLTFLGGAGSHRDLEDLFRIAGVVGAAAGSLFVFKGQYRAVLINYPSPAQKDFICGAAIGSGKF